MNPGDASNTVNTDVSLDVDHVLHLISEIEAQRPVRYLMAHRLIVPGHAAVIRNDLVICHPDNEEQLRTAMTGQGFRVYTASNAMAAEYFMTPTPETRK